MSFSGKNDAESLWNFVKNFILNPNHAKLDQKSWFGHVRTCQVVIWTCPDLSRRTSTYFKPSEILLFFQILLQTIGNTFIFSDFTPFHFLLANLSFFYKITGFTKQTYYYLYFYFFIKSSILLSKFSICYKIIGFTKQNHVSTFVFEILRLLYVY